MNNIKLMILNFLLRKLYFLKKNHKKPCNIGILIVMIIISFIFECLGWYINHKSFLLNTNHIIIIIMQVAIIGIIAIGTTQVIITTGIDLSSGSVASLAAVISASLAQTSDSPIPIFPSLLNLPMIIPIITGIFVGLICGIFNGIIIIYTKAPPFIVTLGMMLFSRGIANFYTKGQTIDFLSDNFIFIGKGLNPVIIFIFLVILFHFILEYTKYGKYLYIIGNNVIGTKKNIFKININKYLIIVYAIAGFLSGLAGVLLAAKLDSGRFNMGISYELDAITASVVGGIYLTGGVGKITGMFLGVIILGIIKSGFIFIGLDVYFQDMIKGILIIIVVSINLFFHRLTK